MTSGLLIYLLIVHVLMDLQRMIGKLSDGAVPFKKQDYAELKKHHREENTLFIDPTFPAIDSVIGTSSIPSNIQWKRPGDICANPRLFSDVEKSQIVRPGELSCNWIVSACAVLSGVLEIRNKVIPEYWEQEWDATRPEQYCGLFHFRFWRFGRWYDVVVDDLLPTVDNTLLTLQGDLENEFWPALVEKAYAKLHGSYDALREGHLNDALVDFTGGVSEVIDLQAEEYSKHEDKRREFFEMLLNEMAHHSLMCFSVVAPLPNDIGTRTSLGINKGHAYHVTDVRRIHLAETNLRNLFKGRQKASMVRLRDPRDEGRRPTSADSGTRSASEGEYAYSTSSITRMLSANTEWSKVKEYERTRLGLHLRDKSEFWMPLEDIVSEFNELYLCRMLSQNVFAQARRRWHEAEVVGAWRMGLPGTSSDRAGGSTSDTLLRNPQYACDIKDEDELIIQLMQFHDAERIETEPVAFLNFPIGFSMLKVEDNRVIRLHKQWPHCPTVVTLDHKRRREIVYKGHISEGRYIIVPTTFKANECTNYYLRVYSRSNIHLRELKEDLPKCPIMLSCLTGDFEWATVVTIHSAECLTRVGESYWKSTKISPYCKIKCEARKCSTPVATDDLYPTWNNSYVFYRKNVDKPLIIRVYSRNLLLPDTLIGECELPAPITRSPTPLAATLIPRIRKSNSNSDDDLPSSTAGTLHLSILTEDNFMAVYLGSGCTIMDLHYQYRLGHSTICKIVRKVCGAVWKVMVNECIPKFSEQKWLSNAAAFQKEANFPNCLGALDGKHVRIIKPDFAGSSFFNYKKFHSIVLFVVADANYEFNYIEVGSCGRESDSTIFQRSKLNAMLTNNEACIPEGRALPGSTGPAMPYTFLGDEAFALSEHIMRPFTGKFLSHKKRVYNYRVSRGRRFVECAFGILTNKWRIFHRAMNVNLSLTIEIVKSCCILHNFVRRRDGVVFEDTLSVQGLFDIDNHDSRPIIQSGLSLNARRNVLADYFVSEIGSLPWQDKYC